MDDEAGVDRQVLHEPRVKLFAVVQVGHLLGAQIDIRLTGVSRINREFCAILLGSQTDGCSLHPKRKVFGDDGDRQPIVGEVERNGKDARVVVAELESRREHRHVGVVEFDPQRTALPHRDRKVEAFVLHA